MIHDASAPVSPPPVSLWRVLLGTFRAAPKPSRRIVLGLIAGLVVIITLQLVFDLDNSRGTWGVAESMALCLGISGVYLMLIAHALEVASQRGAACEGAFKVSEPRVLHQMLQASPALGVGAGLLLGAGAGVNAVRALFRGPEYLIMVAAFLLVGWLVARAAYRTSRFLYNHAREQAELAARAETEATEARLSALAAQVHPHYLFNALNTVAALVRTDPKAAERMVENVSQVLRRTLDRSDRVTAPLAEEIDYLKAYLAVEKERRGERLRVSYRVESETLDLPVPPLVLQPLVENALKHGLAERLEGGAVEIAAEVRGGQLLLTVSDDGLGLAPRHPEGTGLSNLRQRLLTLYGESASVSLEARAPGVQATVAIPLARS